MEAFLLGGLFCICAAVFKQLLAVEQDFVLLDHLAVLVALKFSKRIRMLSLVTSSLQLALELVSLSCLGLDKILLLEYDLFEGPAALHPSLQVLFNLFVAHLPAFNFFAHSPSLPLHGLHLNRHRVKFGFANGFNHFFKLGFATPRIFQLVFEPQGH